MRSPRSSLVLLALWTPRPRRTASFSPIPSSCRDAPLQASATTVTDAFVGNDIGVDLRGQQGASDTCISDEGSLAALFGSADARDGFFAHNYGRRVTYFPRSEMPVLSDNQRLEPPIVGIDLPSLYESNEYINLRKRGSRDLLDKSATSYGDLTSYIAGGGSIIIPITPDDYLNSTKVEIEHALGVVKDTGTSMNIYHSGPSAVALNIHYDAYPVFVLQLVGQKEWIIQNDSFGRPSSEVNAWKNITMTEGDLLYIPKGVWHAATTAAGYETTTHATIGLM